MNGTEIRYEDIFNAENAKAIFGSLLSFPWVKATLAFFFLVINWIFGAELESLAVIGFLVILDTMTGFFKAYKNNAVTSHGFFRFSLKIVIYFFLLATGALVDKVMPFSFALMAMATFLGATEAISVLENLKVFGFEVPTGLIDRLKSVKEKVFKAKAEEAPAAEATTEAQA